MQTPERMAILSALFSFVGKKAGDLFQAILGWSVTALFGRLQGVKQTALSAILVAALLWPILVVGIFFPSITAWMVAAMPLHHWIGDRAIRIASIVLAVILPPLIGLAVHYVAPPRVRRGGVWRTVVGGFPLTLGFAVACVTTAVTVPVVKVISAAKRWSDEHIFVQPMPDSYGQAAAELAKAIERAGLHAHIEDVPVVMSVGTRVLLWFAQGTLDALVSERVKRIRADGVELYLYPGDLLLRGQAQRAARVRAKMNTTMLVRTAYLVESVPAQRLQDEIARMWDVLERHRQPDEIGGLARGRLKEIAGELESKDIPYEQWAILDRELLRVERAFGGGLRIPVEGEHAATAGEDAASATRRAS